MTVRIGTSGWSYDHWEPELYPHGLPAGERLGRYAAVFRTGELNSDPDTQVQLCINVPIGDVSIEL